jgi:hypothetical protein
MVNMPDEPPAERSNAAEESPQPVDKEERARQVFFEHLLRRGELIDIDEGMELGRLPPHVTHVRYPDGRVERIGFA